jgi:hypothetical protein
MYNDQCIHGSYIKCCNARNIGDCSIHPLMDATMMAMEFGSSWFHINNAEEYRIMSSLTKEEHVAAKLKKSEEETLRIERSKKAEEERAASILKSRVTKAIGDAKDIARSFNRRKVDPTGRICSWIRLKQEATHLLECGDSCSSLLSEKWLTPGKDRIAVKDALRGCFVHNEFLKGAIKNDCIFSHDDSKWRS